MKKYELNKIGSLLNNYTNETGKDDVIDAIIDVTNIFELANTIEKIIPINNNNIAREINQILIKIMDEIEGVDVIKCDYYNYSVEEAFNLIMTYYYYHQSLTAK